jgi:hypothetical protein
MRLQVIAEGFEESPQPEIQVDDPPQGRLELTGVSPSVSTSPAPRDGRPRRARAGQRAACVPCGPGEGPNHHRGERCAAAVATAGARQPAGLDAWLAECDARAYAPGGSSRALDAPMRARALALADQIVKDELR